jgi:hypothetical protein
VFPAPDFIAILTILYLTARYRWQVIKDIIIKLVVLFLLGIYRILILRDTNYTQYDSVLAALRMYTAKKNYKKRKVPPE